MAKTAIISVDGHVRASRSDYRNYVEQRFLPAFDAWASTEEAAGAPESGNLSAGLDPTSQWDSDLRLKDMESQGVVAEVLFPNGLPSGPGRPTMWARSPTPRSTGRRVWPTTAGWPTSAPRHQTVPTGRRSSRSTTWTWPWRTSIGPRSTGWEGS